MKDRIINKLSNFKKVKIGGTNGQEKKKVANKEEEE